MLKLSLAFSLQTIDFTETLTFYTCYSLLSISQKHNEPNYSPPWNPSTLVPLFLSIEYMEINERCLRSCLLLIQLPGKGVTLLPLLHSICYPFQHKMFHLSFRTKFPQAVAVSQLPWLFLKCFMQRALRTTANLLHYCFFWLRRVKTQVHRS